MNDCERSIVHSPLRTEWYHDAQGDISPVWGFVLVIALLTGALLLTVS